MNRVAIYRRAARKLERMKTYTSFTCEAIAQTITGKDDCEGLYRHRAVQKYLHIFSPLQDGPYEERAGALQREFGSVTDFKDGPGRACRVLALCLMAAMVEAGDA